MSVASIIAAYGRQYGVDPRALMAVASAEGGLGWGAVGDQGSSFGPFQLHVGGALPAGRNAAWANSPAGIEYAVRRISQSGARGLTGRSAIAAIVRNFERPAAPDPEIARAFAWYSGHGGPMPTGPTPPGGGATARAQSPGGGLDPKAMALQMLQNFASSGSTMGVPGQANPFQTLMDMTKAAQGDATHAPAKMPQESFGPGGGRFAAPLPSFVETSPYGPRVGVVSGEKFHYGVDLSAPRGTPIHALTGGKVILSQMYGSGGNTVIIRDAQGREWYYHHMNSLPVVKVGQVIGRGAMLGAVGSTGAATGPHLHIGLQVNGQWTNPIRFIKRAFGR